MQEAPFMMAVLEHAMVAQQREAHQRAESRYIIDDEPTTSHRRMRYRMSTPPGEKLCGHWQISKPSWSRLHS
jgi:hypothetical protein